MVEVFKKIVKDSKIKYLLVGGSSVLLEYGVFVALIFVSISAGWANAISFLIGFVYTFILHNTWSFAGDHARSRYIKFTAYAVLAAVNTFITSALIVFQVEYLEVSPFIAKIICMALVVVWNYLILNTVIFRRKTENTQ